MIAKKARATFYKLPTSQQLGTSVEDLINDGKTWLLSVIKKFDPRKYIKFSTWAFAVLDNFYIDVIRSAYADKARARVLSADSSTVWSKDRESTQSLYDFLKNNRRDRRDIAEDKIILRIDAERAFIKVYAGSSTMLRKYLIRWFLQPRASKNERGSWKPGIDSRAAIQSLNSEILTEELCRTILSDHQCRSNIANKLMTKFLTPKHPGKPILTVYDALESEILPILNPDRQKSLIALVA
jgi:hypothetical protein